ncbi:MAG: GNAT family N-acetyltransferase [Ktedonobacteraceae bacterium]|nr:GNAT family N-acetyltransferase [Ktedonobacteraceae bacterium]
MNKQISLAIRDAREDERSTIQTVTLAAYEEYATIMPRPWWEAYRRQLLLTLDEERPVERIVAESEGAIVGSVLLYPPLAQVYPGAEVGAGWPEVRLLAVAPAARGQGVASALMDECERRARRAGATTLGLHTMDMMREAMHLYERRGFIRAPERDFYPAEGVVVKGYGLTLDA